MTRTIDPAPQTDRERYASAYAVGQERKASERDAAVDSLTDRERLLIEYAWEAGAKETRDRIARELHNPHAATLDAKAVASTINSIRELPIVFDRGMWDPKPHHDPRVVSLVHTVTHELKQKQ